MIEKHTELSLLVEQVIVGQPEQLDELKASTLGNYIGKGDKDLDRLSRKKWDMIIKSHDMSPEEIEKTRPEYDETKRKEGNRKKGVKTALAKFAKGNYDERNSYDPSRYDESLLDQLSDAIEYLDEDQIQLVAEMVVELLEMEQIDELKASTLGSYIKKASHDVATRSAAVARYAEREREATKKGDYKDARLNRKISDKQFDKSWDRRKGIATAADKLVKGQYQEEVEELDELKKETLGNYIKKAKDDYGTRRGEINAYELGSDSRKDAIKTAVKRRKGVDTAVDKLIKGQYQEEYIEEALSELISGVALDEAVKVSKSSEEYYKFTHGKSPEQMSKSTGSGNFAFSTVPSKEHDVRKHDTHFVRASDYTEAKKKAIAHYRELGHNGEIHTLT